MKGSYFISRKGLVLAVSGVVFASGALFGLVFGRQTRAGNTGNTAPVPATDKAVDAPPVLSKEDQPAIAQASPAMTPAALEQTVVPVSTPAAVPVQTPPVAVASGPDGKDMLTDGKTDLPPVKELLEPIKEFINPQSNAVDPRPGDPPAEYLNTANNRLLDPPNPQNTGGPVVSPETR